MSWRVEASGRQGTEGSAWIAPATSSAEPYRAPRIHRSERTRRPIHGAATAPTRAVFQEGCRSGGGLHGPVMTAMVVAHLCRPRLLRTAPNEPVTVRGRRSSSGAGFRLRCGTSAFAARRNGREPFRRAGRRSHPHLLAREHRQLLPAPCSLKACDVRPCRTVSARANLGVLRLLGGANAPLSWHGSDLAWRWMDRTLCNPLPGHPSTVPSATMETRPPCTTAADRGVVDRVHLQRHDQVPGPCWVVVTSKVHS